MPNWNYKTLIIGTFNPENLFHPGNEANYFYGRDRSLFWCTLPQFAGLVGIPRAAIDQQIEFLRTMQVGITDLLVSIDDADVNKPRDCTKIQTVIDKEIETFVEFTWNTTNIINEIVNNEVQAVYFTKLGLPAAQNPAVYTFEYQMRQIEAFCNAQRISHHRLHTPTGLGLGPGRPRLNRLINVWYLENGGNEFPFLHEDFDINQFPYVV